MFKHSRFKITKLILITIDLKQVIAEKEFTIKPYY